VSDLFAALAATWPAASTRAIGAFTLRDGAGGGKRAGAATLDGPFDARKLDAVLGQTDLMMVRDGQDDLDAALAARGWTVADPTLLLAARCQALARPVPPLAALPVWPPLAIQRRIWTDAGTGPARQAVMERASTPKAAFLARAHDKIAGTAFVAVAGDVAMVHAVEILPAMRRRGAATTTMHAIANWALQHGAHSLALAVTRANAPALALYAGLGLTEAGSYHYRQAPPA
jgi:N-acetylglutamate synthase